MCASWFAQYTKRITRPRSVPSDAVVTLLSLAEDLATFIGSVLTLVVPYFGYVPPAASTAVYLRTGHRRRAKYRRFRRQAAAGRLQRRAPMHDLTQDHAAQSGSADATPGGTPANGNGARPHEAPAGATEDDAADRAQEPVPLRPAVGDDDD